MGCGCNKKKKNAKYSKSGKKRRRVAGGRKPKIQTKSIIRLKKRK